MKMSRAVQIALLLGVLTLAAILLMKSGRPTARPRIFTNRYEMKLVLVPAGSFQMGSSEREAQMMFERFLRIDTDTKLKWFSNATPKHRVEIRHSFYMGQTEVTQKQWGAVMGKTIREQRDEDNPNSPLYGEGDGEVIGVDGTGSHVVERG